jgi:hypothetical protein
MSKYQAQSNAEDSGALDVSKVIKLTTDQLAIERAVQLMDSYILEKWQEIPRPPVSHDADAA